MNNVSKPVRAQRAQKINQIEEQYEDADQHVDEQFDANQEVASVNEAPKTIDQLYNALPSDKRAIVDKEFMIGDMISFGNEIALRLLQQVSHYEKCHELSSYNNKTLGMFKLAVTTFLSQAGMAGQENNKMLRARLIELGKE